MRVEPKARRQAHQGSTGVHPERSARSPLYGEHSHFCKNTVEAPQSNATQHTTSYEVVVLHPTQGSREPTLSSGEGAPSDIAIHSGREGIKASRKTCIPTATLGDKRQARPLTYHFKRLLE
jgi:hypothetical protein